jgi:hypothetical protein
MFSSDTTAPAAAPTRSFSFRLALTLTGVMTVVVGLYPEPFLRFARTMTRFGV